MPRGNPSTDVIDERPTKTLTPEYPAFRVEVAMNGHLMRYDVHPSTGMSITHSATHSLACSCFHPSEDSTEDPEPLPTW